MTGEWKPPQYHETYVPCTCHTCGKVCVPPLKTMWAYRREPLKAERKPGEYTVYFCSWGCLRKYDRAREKRPETRGRKKKEVTA